MFYSQLKNRSQNLQSHNPSSHNLSPQSSHAVNQTEKKLVQSEIRAEQKPKESLVSTLQVNSQSSLQERIANLKVEDEREQKMELFVQVAKEVCGRLKEEGYWADFIDPCSGTPYYSGHTNTTMFETDEKFRALGFRIEDLGCCKVILHPGFGKNVFVGCIVTNASKSNYIIEEIFEDIL